MNKLITAAISRPVLLTDAKLHARVDTSDDDALIESLIKTATLEAENITGRKLITQTWEYVLSDFEDEMDLSFAPVQSIAWIKYQDANNAEQTLANSVYDLIDEAMPPRVVLKSGQSWPSVYTAEDAVRIRYVAGYGSDPSAVPEPIRMWINMRVASIYAQRESFVNGQVATMPGNFVDGLLDAYRLLRAG